MGERKASEVIPDNVWNAVVENADGHKEVHWKGKVEYLIRKFDFLSSLDMNQIERIKHVGLLIGKFLGLLSLLYIFVCSLDIMSSAFRLVGGEYNLIIESKFDFCLDCD